MVSGAHEEVVYDLIPKEEFVERKPLGAKFYTSKFRRQVVEEREQQRKGERRTLGEAEATHPHSNGNFQKKNRNVRDVPVRGKADTTGGFRYERGQRRAPVPHINERPIMGLRTQKNFIHENAVENIMSVPKKPAKIFVDTRKGDKHDLPPSGLEPRYLMRSDFGKVPNYLKQRKEDMERSQAEYDAYVAEKMRQGAMQRLTDDERRLIIKGLKSNWERIHHEFQGISVMVDTIPKKQRKERMEQEMKNLEKDIELLERHKIIYIAN